MNDLRVNRKGQGALTVKSSKLRGRVGAVGRAPGQAFALVTLVFAAVSMTAVADTGTTPQYTMRDKTPTLRAYINATVFTSPEIKLDSATLICEHGVIQKVGKAVSIPDGAEVIDLAGKTVYPGFIEPYADYGLEKPQRTPGNFSDGQVFEQERIGGNAWNGAVHSERNCVDGFKPSKEAAKGLIKLGFTVSRNAVLDGIFRGRSFVSTLDDGSANDVLLMSEGARFMSFDKGSSKMSYPSSLMGSIALIRQTFLDAQWYEQAQSAYTKGPAQEKPEYNAALAALANAKAGRYVFEADDELSLLRADKIAKEFGLSFTYLGSGYEYARLKDVAATGAELILPLDFPSAPEVKTLNDELDVSLAKLRHWETAPSNPARLAEAGVTFALTSHGPKKRDSFWGHVRKAVKRGLTKETALASLTVVPAKMLNIESMAGTIEPGKLANFVVTDGDIFDKDTKILSVYIKGEENEVTEKPPLDYRGTYDLALGKYTWPLKLSGKPEKLKGEIILGEVDSAEVKRSLTKPVVRAEELLFGVKLDTLGYEGVLRFSARLDSSTLVGQVALADGSFLKWRAPLREEYDPAAEKKKAKDKSEKEGKSDDPDNSSEKDSGEPSEGKAKDEDKPEELVAHLTYPNMAFGWETPPQTEDVMIQNATVWTCDDNGVLKDADVLIRKGKISKVGVDLSVPSGVRVIDGTGKHVTPGIMDEHSHIAISGAVNECTESITAEVRIGDVVNSDDISIYRQLSGGVTASRLLHGSCNPIGGQAQLIKLRWGSTPEEMKFKAAPPSVKFALGENVKRSNFGDAFNKRYPQTRMGVETIIKDGFRAALENEADWNSYNKLGAAARQSMIPPRRDLEFDALNDIIDSKMFITCHSYVQSEILMLMRLAEEFGFHVQTFTHILEGYKVADEMAAHGAGGSTFSDWWAYKFEVYDAIPYNATLMTEKGVVTCINSDNSEMARRLNQEAGKSVMYGGMSQEEALKMVTLNPAIQLQVDDHVGSITPGKDADFVIWNGNPLSVYSSVEQTWIDGKNYFSKEHDLHLREELKEEKSKLIQKALADSEGGAKGGGHWKKPAQEWHCDDVVDYWRTR